MKLLGVVSTYYPDLFDLERNILSYLHGVDYLIIWENTPKDKSNIEKLIAKLNSSKIELRTSGKNEFLAYPFNECIKWAEKQNFTHILTMDQDSSFGDNQFEKYTCLVAKHANEDTMAFTTNKGESISNVIFDEIEVENTITSGSIYKLDVFNKIGYFREDFLIYMIDIEFGMRIKYNHYKIFCFPKVILQHHAGYAQINKFGLRIDNYSAQSTYYIIRNVMLNWKLYSKQFSWKEKLKFFKYKIGYRTIKLPFEENSFLKLKAIYIAFFHGLIGKSGRYDI
jgi:rhamnosyltransferase